MVLYRSAPQPRRQVAFALWPDSAEAQALTNVRNLTHKLRHALPHADQVLCLEGPTLCWRSEVPVMLDVATFEQDIASAEQTWLQAEPLHEMVLMKLCPCAKPARPGYGAFKLTVLSC